MSSPATSQPYLNTALTIRGDQPLSLLRLYMLRAGYLLMAVGLAVTRGPLLIGHDASWALMD
jgi:hypothetical protein